MSVSTAPQYTDAGRKPEGAHLSLKLFHPRAFAIHPHAPPWVHRVAPNHAARSLEGCFEDKLAGHAAFDPEATRHVRPQRLCHPRIEKNLQARPRPKDFRLG